MEKRLARGALLRATYPYTAGLKVAHLKKTVGDLMDEGCPLCDRTMYLEASTYFGSLYCPEHGCVWLFIPCDSDRRGYAPASWINKLTGQSSPAYDKRWRLIEEVTDERETT